VQKIHGVQDNGFIPGTVHAQSPNFHKKMFAALLTLISLM